MKNHVDNICLLKDVADQVSKNQRNKKNRLQCKYKDLSIESRKTYHLCSKSLVLIIGVLKMTSIKANKYAEQFDGVPKICELH